MFDPAPHWQAVKSLFHQASELPPAEREVFLAHACAGDDGLRDDVASLLAEEAAGDEAFLDVPLLASQALRDIALQRNIGPYQITALIGRGGMGTVYSAIRADDVYQRRVAIKVVNRGMDTEDVVHRFRHERRTLARLDHPNIARIIDGGTTEDGLPYFVMDFVDGVPIDAYCDAARLTITQRIELFRTVCGAVSYAHQNLVVHRDLKPENILVTADGVPKLLDFGVAKVLAGDATESVAKVTRLMDRRMTLSHASPEQVRGLPITTTSDVYSLGVLFYTLLSGRRPYKISGASSDEAARAICEITAPPASAWLQHLPAHESAADADGASADEIAARRSTTISGLTRQLSGDPERIIAMAMRKEPERRYASVEQLSADLGRYLRGMPVTARADTLSYRTSKFVQRHRVGVMAATIAAIGLAGGVAATLWQARVAQAERQIAERRFADVRQLANSLLFEIHDAIADLPGSTAARELLVRRALEYVDTLATESTADGALQLDLAAAYQRIGDVQGNPTNANLGDMAAAEQSYRKGLAIAEKLSAVTGADPHARRALARLYQKSGDLRAFLGDPTGAIEQQQRALQVYESEAARAKTDGAVHLAWAVSHIKLADVQGNPDFPNAGDASSAMQHYQAALPIVEALPSDMAPQRLRYLGLLHERIGRMQQARAEFTDALEHYRTSLGFRQQWATLQPTHVDARRDLAIGYEKIGNVLRSTGDLPGALHSHRTAAPIFDELVQADPANTNALRSVAINREQTGDVLVDVGDLVGAEREYRAASDIQARIAARSPGNVQAKGDLSRVNQTLDRIAAQRIASHR